ncbi:hypothetical protein VTI74DRAFT_2342 [Chaetomium olivicolor]
MTAFSWRLSLASLFSVLSAARGNDVKISSISGPPEWQLASLMHVQLTPPETRAAQLTYSVYPLTEHAGLNQTDRNRILIRGSLVAADLAPNPDGVVDSETIAFMSCDDDFATGRVRKIMADMPKAILLYSIYRGGCSLEGHVNATSVYTMGDSNEARDTRNNTVRAGGTLRATITGDPNVTATPPGTQEEHSSSTSAVAMSILYSITGLITLVFLIIIGLGAFRAHRYPERYGPRSGFGRQSRAKGLARAVLDTLPIVKFGDPDPPKPDPALELESQSSRAEPNPVTGTRLSAIPEEPRSLQSGRVEAPPMSGAVPERIEQEATPAGTHAEEPDTAGGGQDGPSAKKGCRSEENLGCSICTEDFQVGEDVRVLPCNHKFHPPCIDPWLVNVSGTCPLCRLNLHKHARRRSTASTQSHDDFLSAPPLRATTENVDADLDDGNPILTTNPISPASNRDSNSHHHRRPSRFLDFHRLRHASLEERIEMLRRHRSRERERERERERDSAPAQHATDEEEDERRGRRARLADRLREVFQVRTGPEQGGAGGDGGRGDGFERAGEGGG